MIIPLTRLQGERVYVNTENIQWIECQPDTTITLLNGVRFIVREGLEEVLSLMHSSEPLIRDVHPVEQCDPSCSIL